MSKRQGQRQGRGPIERILFTFMGPPQLGDVNGPVTVAPDPAADLCRKCTRSWAEHEVVRTGSMTYAVCPAVEGAPAAP